jgi:hypothetical protein
LERVGSRQQYYDPDGHENVPHAVQIFVVVRRFQKYENRQADAHDDDPQRNVNVEVSLVQEQLPDLPPLQEPVDGDDDESRRYGQHEPPDPRLVDGRRERQDYGARYVAHGRPVGRQIGDGDQRDPDGQEGAVKIGELQGPQARYAEAYDLLAGVAGVVERREEEDGEVDDRLDVVFAPIGDVHRRQEHQVAQHQQEQLDHDHVVGGRLGVVGAVPT